ncbi:MAG: ornithine carbamoyltransferase [Hydrogenophilales bacterium]
MRHFLENINFSVDSYHEIFNRTKFLKNKFKNHESHNFLNGKTLVMIFEKQSTRTRLSFEAGMFQLGGHSIYLNTRDSQLGRGEPIEDAAQVISRMSDIVMIRTHEHETIERFAKHSRVPVINGLTNFFHPCQILADVYTYIEKFDSIEDREIAWIGDSNNVCNSWIQASKIFNFNLKISSPEGYKPKENLLNISKDKVNIFDDPYEAAKNSDVIITDVWASMGDEKELNKRERDFSSWQVNKKMMSIAKKNCIFMHCLPAHRNKEVTSEVIDGNQSVVWDEAENRLHTQKALMEYMLI